MLGYIRNWFRSNKEYQEIDLSVQYGKNVETGTWTEIGGGTIIGNNVMLGDWVKIGCNVIVEDNCIIPDYVRIMPNSRVKAGTVFKGNELVFGYGQQVPDCCSGSVTSVIEIDGKDYMKVVFIAGTFLIPGNDFNYANELMESFMWGIHDIIMDFEMEKTLE
jgi:carbonic anhydrase/acetyltransferase-like protein (isoleucine patch superfamily)